MTTGESLVWHSHCHKPVWLGSGRPRQMVLAGNVPAYCLEAAFRLSRSQWVTSTMGDLLRLDDLVYRIHPDAIIM